MDSSSLKKAFAQLALEMKAKFNRHVSAGDLVSDRWEIAQRWGFGEGTSCYDNVLIIGSVKVGKHVWIGPNVILDGSGGLEIGDCCSISAGVQIYTHHTVQRAVTMGRAAIEYARTHLGNGVYVGPNSVIEMGVKIGDRAVVGAMSFVNGDVAADTRVWGCPARPHP